MSQENIFWKLLHQVSHLNRVRVMSWLMSVQIGWFMSSKCVVDQKHAILFPVTLRIPFRTIPLEETGFFRHSHPNCLVLDGLVLYKTQLESVLTQDLEGQLCAQPAQAWSPSSANQAPQLQMLNCNRVMLPQWQMWSLFLTEHWFWSLGTATRGPTVLHHFRGLCQLNSAELSYRLGSS